MSELLSEACQSSKQIPGQVPTQIPEVPKSYFELFGLSEGFQVNLDELSGRYHDLQKRLHPDRFASAPDQERRLALKRIVHVNVGFQVLKDPLERAQHLLSLRGIESEGEHSTTVNDPEFLEQQMELRERLGLISRADDPIDALGHFLAELDIKVRIYARELSEQFALNSAESLAQARDMTHQLSFVRRLQQEAEALEDELI